VREIIKGKYQEEKWGGIYEKSYKKKKDQTSNTMLGSLQGEGGTLA